MKIHYYDPLRTLELPAIVVSSFKLSNHVKGTLLLTCILLCLSASLASGQAKNDTTFLFSADIHVGFNGTDDTHGFWDDFPAGFPYIADETAVSLPISGHQSHDGCTNSDTSFPSVFPPLRMTKAICDQIQQVRKMRAVPGNSWPTGQFPVNGHTRSFESLGLIATPVGLVAGGDMTDCAGGSSGCDHYSGPVDAQLVGFQSMYEYSSPHFISFNRLPFLPGLVNPDSDVPLPYPLFPGLGNHDIDNAGVHNLMGDWVLATVARTATLEMGKSHTATNWNVNNDTTAYSWDWGNLHVVNVGVYPGSSNEDSGHVLPFIGGNVLDSDNYTWNQSNDAWLAKDLQDHASDGRPVIITSHFGFDDFSLGGAWWNGANRVCGLADLWTKINKFNVIGYYHGHTHGQTPFADPSIRSVYQYPSSKSSPGAVSLAPLPQIPYDIFLPGAGYDQNFAVTRVTDSRMDVAITQDSVDFDNGGKSIYFDTKFTKVLTPAPAVVSHPSSNIIPIPVPSVFGDVPGESQILGFNAGNQAYIIGVDALGIYFIRSIDSSGKPTEVLAGLIGPVISMASYSAQDGTHIVVSQTNQIVDYVFLQNKLNKNWTVNLPSCSLMTFAKGPQNYLVVDFIEPAHGNLLPLTPGNETLTIYQIGSNGLSPVGTPLVTQAFESGVQLQSFPIRFPNQLGMVHFNTDAGSAIFYSLDLNSFSIHTLGQQQQWAAGRIRVLNFPYGAVQILLTTPSAIHVFPGTYRSSGLPLCPETPPDSQSSGSQVWARNPDSPVYVLTVLDDYSGADVSWRGEPAGFPYSGLPSDSPVPQTIDSFVTSTTPDGAGLYVSSYHASGSLTQLAFAQPAGANVTFTTNTNGVTITVNGTPVQLPATISLSPGQTYTFAAPDSSSFGNGYRYVNPSWSSNVQADGTFTVPTTDTTVNLQIVRQALVTLVSNPPGGGNLAGGGWITQGADAGLSETANPGYTFASFSGYSDSGDSTALKLTFKVNSPGMVTGNFSASGGPALSVTTQSQRSDGPNAGQRTIPLAVVNNSASGVGDVTIFAIDGIQVVAGTGTVTLASGIPAAVGNLAPNGTANFSAVMNWPATATRVRFTVHFIGNVDTYKGSSTLTINR